MSIEEPAYTVIEKEEDFELRIYSPMIVAETLVSGSMNQASNAGFRLIADYIFGNNSLREGGNEKISMTAPVAMQPMSEKISMTTPVSMEDLDGQWRVHFVMPSAFTLASLPKPNNAAVTIREVPECRYAVLRFSGLAGEEKTARKTIELMSWLASKGVTPIEAPVLARYNPPWTLPFLRRNELMVRY